MFELPDDKKIAALYVEKNGTYHGLHRIYTWDEDCDARMYQGPYPVIAHPPCQRWGKMWFGSPSHVKKTGVKKLKGDDKGCFKSALFDVRRFGGVLEHPWGSHAWSHFGLNKPQRTGGWIEADDFGGWTCCVEQGEYGHYCPKPTLLYAVGVNHLPELRWGVTKVKESDFPKEAIEKYGFEKCKKIGLMSFKGGGVDNHARIHTPVEFRNILVGLARSVERT